MANRYWNPSGNANWGDANVWAETDGGDPTGVATPTLVDDVFFTSTNVYDCAIAATANCKSLTTTGGTGYTGTISGSGGLSVGVGNFTLSSGITLTYTGTITFAATSGTTIITSGGKTILSKILFNGVGGTFQLGDNLTIGGGNGTDKFKLSNGTFDANGKTVTFNSATTSQQGITGNLTFYNLSLDFSGNTNKALEFWLFNSNITVSNTFTATGNSAVNRILIKSDTFDTQRTITAANVSVANADFRDIKGAGAGSWDLSAITGGSGDCGGNTGITFTTADDWYWHADTGNVSDYSKWYTETNGGGSQMASTRVPLPQDTLHFDSNSFDSSSKTITCNMYRVGSIDFTGATNTPTFSTYPFGYIYGSLLVSDATLNQSSNITIYGTGNIDLGSNTPTNYFSFIGNHTLLSNFNSRGGISLSGSMDFNDFNVTCGTFSSNNTDTRTIRMGNGTLELTGGSSNLFTINSTNLTLYSEQSTIKLSGTSSGTTSCIFQGANCIFNNLIIAMTTNDSSSLRIAGSNTFNNFKIDAGRKVRFTAGTNTTVTTFTAEGTDVAPITLTSNTTSAATLTKAGGGTITVKYCDISYLTATPAGTWLAYTTDGNVDSGNNTGWRFVSGDTRRRAAFIKFF